MGDQLPEEILNPIGVRFVRTGASRIGPSYLGWFEGRSITLAASRCRWWFLRSGVSRRVPSPGRAWL